MVERARRSLWSVWPMVGLLGGGCAHTQDPTSPTVELRHKIDESDRRVATAEQKIEALEDKVFLLTDQLESQRVVASRRTALSRQAGSVGVSDAPVGVGRKAAAMTKADEDDTVHLPVVKLRPPSTPEPTDAVPARGTSGEGDELAPEIVFAGDALSSDANHARLTNTTTLVAAGAAPSRAHGVPSTKSAVPVDSVASDNLGVAPAPPIARALGGSAPSLANAVPSAIDPLRLYRTSYEALRAGHHADAERGFREFLLRFPRHDYADNAQYWLAECFYDRKQFAEAAPEFRAVVSRYPLGNKAPDALLKLAFCLLAMGQEDKGRELLVSLPTNYPRTEAAHLAELRLRDLHVVTGGTR